MKTTLLAALIALIASSAWAARPLVVDDVAPVETGRFQLEAGANYVKDAPTHHFDLPLTLSYGLVKDLQVGVGSGGQFERREAETSGREAAGSFCDVVFASKWNPISQEPHGVALALAGGVKIPTAGCKHGFGNNRVDTDLTLIATRRWSERWGTHLNVGHTWIGTDVDMVHYGVAADLSLTAKLTLVAEVFANTPLNDGTGTSVLCNCGLRCACHADFTLDTAVGTCLCGNEPDLMVTVGFTWLFDFRRK
jgi:hypothetical protein